jgi:hypothetical protein
VLSLDRRRVLHFNVTANPSAAWTAQQVVEAFPHDSAPRFLQRDRDGIYGDEFRRRIKNLGIEEVVSAPRSPWQNPYVERVIGTNRRELLNHVIVLNEAHLKRLLGEFLKYYHRSRAHQSLDCNSPISRDVEPPEAGQVVAIPLDRRLASALLSPRRLTRLALLERPTSAHAARPSSKPRLIGHRAHPSTAKRPGQSDCQLSNNDPRLA